MSFEKTVVRRLAGAAVVACGIGAAAGSLAAQDAAQTPPVLLVLDETAIDHGPPPHLIPFDAVNDQISNIGLRDPIPYFSARVGTSVTLPSGQDGNDGWFALRTVPASWASEPGSDDGLQNFLLAGAGLGSPDDAGSRTSLLGSVPNVVALHAAGLGQLVGRSVCAVVYDGDIIVKPGTPSTTDLSGINLGVVAFQVTGVDTAGGDSPAVTIQIQNVRDTCGGIVDAFADAPDPLVP